MGLLRMQEGDTHCDGCYGVHEKHPNCVLLRKGVCSSRSDVGSPPASPRMQQVRAATAVLALVSCSSHQKAAIVSALADETTSVDIYSSLERLLHSLSEIAPDVVVVNDCGE